MAKLKKIEICGGIASGKTTLSLLLSRLDFSPIFENFHSNPFWQAFYDNPVGTAFETEITFLLQHYHEFKAAAKNAGNFACDFSLLLDLAYARVTLDEGKQAVFEAVYREIRRELPRPDLVIHLTCDPKIELERVQRRGRDVEQSITIDYLEAINQALFSVLHDEAKSWNVLNIDSAALDFANDPTDEITVLELVHSRLDQIASR